MRTTFVKYPLAIVDVTLRPAPELLDLLQSHEEHLEAARLQQPLPAFPICPV
jgi:hypothetical protein